MEKQSEEEPELILYNEEQRFYVNVSDNCTASIKQMEDSIKLQKDIKIMADEKVITLKD